MVEAARTRPWGIGPDPLLRKAVRLRLGHDRVEIEGSFSRAWVSLLGAGWIGAVLGELMMLATVGLKSPSALFAVIGGTLIGAGIGGGIGYLTTPGVLRRRPIVHADPQTQPAVYSPDHGTFCIELDDDLWVDVKPVDPTGLVTEKLHETMKVHYGERLTVQE